MTKLMEGRVLILAPSGRDAQLAAQILEQAGILASVCANVDILLDRYRKGAGAAIVAEEALTPAVVQQLGDALATQLPWSDFPLLIFTSKTTSAQDNRRSLERFAGLENVTALERPIHPLTMVSAVRAALRARGRQYQMRAAFEQREREIRQRDQFLAMLGHELRNPLGAIQNAALLALKLAPSVAALERPLSVIHRQVRNLTQLVDDLLEVARVTSGKIILKRQSIDLGELARQLVVEIRQQSRHRYLTLEFVGPERPVRVMGDGVRLEQILGNLLTNSFKYTLAGGHVRVTVGHDDNTSQAVLSVVDNGMGISAEMLETIFDPFTQSQQTLDRAQGGMGLGLSVVRALVQLHGGQVTATSAGLGHGSTFVVRLPSTAAAPAHNPSVQASRSDGSTPRLRILIVEDSADNRESLAELLETMGHDVAVAVDGESGVQQAVDYRPEVALIDIGMPRMDGFEVARRIRAALGAEMRLVALTGYGQPEDRARALAAGFDEHLTKPLNLPTLENVLGTTAAQNRLPPEHAGI